MADEVNGVESLALGQFGGDLRETVGGRVEYDDLELPFGRGGLHRSRQFFRVGKAAVDEHDLMTRRRKRLGGMLGGGCRDVRPVDRNCQPG